MKEHDYERLEKRLGISRRDFMKFCTGLAATMGLPVGAAQAMADAVATQRKRPVVIWLHGQECTGPSETLLRAERPTLERTVGGQS